MMYSVPTIKMTDYTKDSIFEKNLLMLLPFYIMGYEKKGHDFNNNPELFQTLLNEYEEIRVNLEKELTETGRSELYTDLTELIVKIADYIFREEDEVRKGLGDIMGGKVLELESERLKAEEQAVECASERAKAIWEDFLILTTVRFRQRLIQKFMWIKQNFWTIRIE